LRPAARSILLDEAEEFGDRQGQGGGEALDVDQGQVARAALDVAEVGPVDAGPTLTPVGAGYGFS
jgi:hypothetical protein